MDAFAYISILDVMLKLGVAYTIYAVNLDKLIVYSILMLLVQIAMTSIYAIYCKRHFEETRFKRLWDTSLLKEMGSFAGWNMCGNVAYILFTQGLNILLNMFFGPVVNAARGGSPGSRSDNAVCRRLPDSDQPANHKNILTE